MIYDAVIVGAGNAGLSAALCLASAGKQVLLLERQLQPGGCATAFRRGRFEFDLSMHELCDYGAPGAGGGVRALFERWGVKADFLPLKHCFRLIATGSDGTPLDVTLPAGTESFIAATEYYAPGSRECVTKFFDLARETDEALGFLGAGGGEHPVSLLRHYAGALRYGTYPVSQVFDALDLPMRVRDILGAYWSYLGVPLDRLSFIHYASMFYRYVSLGPCIPVQNAHGLSLALLERFRTLGGRIRLGVSAERILFENGKLCGVHTDHGDIACRCVLANVNPDVLYGKMVPPELASERQRRLSAARAGRRLGHVFTLHLGLNRTAQQLGIRDYTIMLAGSADSRLEAEAMKHAETNEYAIFVCYDLANPAASPEGCCTCSLTAFQSAADWHEISPEKYNAKKNAFARRLLTLFRRKTGIDLQPHIEELSIASPVSFAHWLGTPEGAAYGFAPEGWDGVMARAMQFDRDCDLPGLIPIGAAGVRGNGYNANYTSGRIGAELALSRLAGKEQV